MTTIAAPRNGRKLSTRWLLYLRLLLAGVFYLISL